LSGELVTLQWSNAEVEGGTHTPHTTHTPHHGLFWSDGRTDRQRDRQGRAGQNRAGGQIRWVAGDTNKWGVLGRLGWGVST